ncbi:hypothetical protein BZG36_01359 [Bifiguratus adelaidae]|uniref:START domain-containing protein n=1 Tax=Bifiguratus adelaidae TaxID=1938954 RepID=A0A261Y3E6_9FUNG|nr:hypothetical protein BZG36_01359 [Bifiguratus adelaidae]
MISDSPIHSRQAQALPRIASPVSQPPLTPKYEYQLYQSLVNHALYKLHRYVTFDRWQRAYKHPSGIVVYQRQIDAQGRTRSQSKWAVMGIGVLRDLGTVEDVFHAIVNQGIWDESFVEEHLIENIDQQTSLTYEVHRRKALAGACRARHVDYVLCESHRTVSMPQPRTYFASVSIDHSSYPKVKGILRGHVDFQGWSMELVEGGKGVRICCVLEGGNKGWTTNPPQTLLSKPLAILPVILSIRRQSVGLAPMDIVRQSWTPSSRCEGLVAAEVRDRDIPLQSATFPPLAASPRTPVPTRPHSQPPTHRNANRLSFHSIRSSGEGTSRTPNLAARPKSSPPSRDTYTLEPETKLYPPHRHPKSQQRALELFEYLLDDNSDWSQDDTGTFVKHIDGAGVVWKGDTMITGWSPEELCSWVMCFGLRSFWEPRFVSATIKERFSQREYLVHTFLSLQSDQRHPPTSTHDLLLLTTIHTQSNSPVIHAISTSVRDPTTPKVPGITRGYCALYGFSFRPFPDSPFKTRVTQIILNAPHTQKVFEVPGTTLNTFASALARYGTPPHVRRIAGKVLEEQYDRQRHAAIWTMRFIAEKQPDWLLRRSHFSDGPATLNETAKALTQLGWFTDIHLGRGWCPRGYGISVVIRAQRCLVHAERAGKQHAQCLRIWSYGDGVVEVVIEPEKREQGDAVSIHILEGDWNSHLVDSLRLGEKSNDTNAASRPEVGVNLKRVPESNATTHSVSLTSGHLSVDADPDIKPNSSSQPRPNSENGLPLLQDTVDNTTTGSRDPRVVLVLTDDIYFTSSQLAVIGGWLMCAWWLSRWACE